MKRYIPREMRVENHVAIERVSQCIKYSLSETKLSPHFILQRDPKRFSPTNSTLISQKSGRIKKETKESRNEPENYIQSPT
jgi:hypothetical protein